MWENIFDRPSMKSCSDNRNRKTIYYNFTRAFRRAAFWTVLRDIASFSHTTINDGNAQ